MNQPTKNALLTLFLIFGIYCYTTQAQGLSKLKALKGAQNVNVYFSNTPLTVGMENSMKNADAEFTDQDIIYAMAVIEKEAYNRSFVRDYCYLGDKKAFLGAHVVFENGKTYAFFDILPDPERPTSKDAVKWSKIITGLPKGKAQKLRIEVTAKKTKAVGTLKIKHTGTNDNQIVSNAEQAVNNFEKVLKKQETDALAKEQAERDNEDRARDLPEVWRINDLTEVMNETDLDSRDKVITKIKEVWNDVTEVVYLSNPKTQDWAIFTSTQNQEIVSHKRMSYPIKAVYKKDDGWCMAVEILFGRKNMGGINTEYGPIYIDTDKGFRFDCGKL